MSDAKLDSLIAEWLRLDQNVATRTEITNLVANGQFDQLRTRLEARMEFGTAGLRSAMGAGYSRMNDVTIIQTTQGFCKYLQAAEPKVKSMGVVIGYDARYNSQRFAQLAAVAMISQGIKVYLYSGICPTPFVPFAVLKYEAAAGIMVTASHNPKDDNGYKVYWSNGAQIISPHDKHIAKAINENLEPWPHAWDIGMLESETHKSLVYDPSQEVLDSYMKAIQRNSYISSWSTAEKSLKIVYTAMHGVGHEFAAKAFESYRLPLYIPVIEQIQPDPEFPTVKFPNPEEGKSALDLAIKTAEESGSSVILANDPDADRLAVAEKRSDGSWKIFNGNEIAVLLSNWILMNYKQSRNGDASKAAMVASTVSSKFLKALAETENFRFEETLTGFKWIGNKVIDLEKQGFDVVFAYEEAIGFMSGTVVYDKDGISAAVVMAELANYLHSQKKTLCSYLDEMYLKYGYFASINSYYLCYSQPTIKKIFDQVRKDQKYPVSFGDYKVKHVRDLTTGFDNAQPENKAILPTSSSSQMITFTFENGAVVTVRTSGTEPKIKYYTELRGKAASKEGFSAIEEDLSHLVDLIVKEMLQPETNGLIPKSD